MRIGGKVFFTLLGPTRGGAPTEILRFTVENVCDKWLVEIKMYYLDAILVNRADQRQACINFCTLPT